MKKKLVSMVLGVTMMVTGTGAAFANPVQNNQVDNVILLVPDGMSGGGTTLARWMNGGQPLALDAIASGLVRTHWAAGPITDSAPAGTAMATGHKSTDKFVGVTAKEHNMPGLAALEKDKAVTPVATVLEAAKLAGKSTGLIATSNIQHATPAAFSSHYPDRSKYELLGEQQVYNNIDVVLGAGSQYLEGDKRKDGEDLVKVLEQRGYDYVDNRSEMMNSTSSKIWGMFAPDSLAYDMDRDVEKEPSLAEMTKKAIDVLDKDDDGFFLLVEGSKVDWAAHANDPIGVVSDVLAFDEAVKVALDFAKKDKNTAVIAVTDHNNGGITIGHSNTDGNYSKLGLDAFTGQLKKAILTGEGIAAKLNADRSNVREVMAKYYGINDLTDGEVQEIKGADLSELNYVVGPMISERANIGWTTTGHTGEDVTLYSYHPNASQKLQGTIDNTDIANYIADVMDLDLDEATRELYVSARAGFAAIGAEIKFDNSNPNQVFLTVTKGEHTLRLDVDKSVGILDGKEVELNGLVLFINQVYVPQSAINLLT